MTYEGRLTERALACVISTSPQSTRSPPEASIEGVDGDEDEDEDDDQYYYPSARDVEDVECYRPGGYHPVHLGDQFDNGRFRIMHKLGSGGFATVWLARDQKTNSYVALKVHRSTELKGDQELDFLELLEKLERTPSDTFPYVRLLHQFRFEGPNGTHLCTVTTVAGPSIKDFSKWGRRLAVAQAQRVARQLVNATAYLHDLGICHGDLTPGNALLQLKDFNSWTEDQIYERLGQPWIDPVLRRNDLPPGPNAPRYIVEPIEFAVLENKWLFDNIELIDFGEAFFISAPPSAMLGTPLNYLAPENIYQLRAGVHTDDWALACVIFFIRAGRHLMNIQGFGSIPDAVHEMIHLLGPLPGHWALIQFDDEGLPLRDGTLDNTKEPNSWLLPGEKLEHPLIDLVRDIEADQDDTSTFKVPKYFKLSVENQEGETINSYLRPRELGQKYSGDSDDSDDEEDLDILVYLSEDQIEAKEERHRKAPKISDEEAECLFDLLRKVLHYDAGQRISTAEMAEHPWLHEKFPRSRPGD